MDTRPIGVFDSGLGGLTAVRQLRRLLPGAFDTGNPDTVDIADIQENQQI